MQTRQLIIASLVLIVGLAWSGTASADPLKKRLKIQHHRINHGIAIGELTYKEVRKLRRYHRKIHRQRHHFLADGHLSHRERRILERRLDRNSGLIYALKHNDRYAYDRGWYRRYH